MSSDLNLELGFTLCTLYDLKTQMEELEQKFMDLGDRLTEPPLLDHILAIPIEERLPLLKRTLVFKHLPKKDEPWNKTLETYSANEACALIDVFQECLPEINVVMGPIEKTQIEFLPKAKHEFNLEEYNTRLLQSLQKRETQSHETSFETRQHEAFMASFDDIQEQQP